MELVSVTTVAGFPVQKSTVEAGVKPLPVTVTTVPPAVGPAAGTRAVTAGAGS